MTPKEIIDKHFQERYNYYRSICFTVTGKDDDVYKDLLHETYLAFLIIKDDVIIQFSKIDKLHYLGIRTIKQLFGKRFCKKKYSKNLSSPLFMAVDEFFRIDRPTEYFGRLASGTNVHRIIEVDNNEVFSFELQDSNEQPKYSEQDYLRLDKAIAELLRDPIKTVGVTIFLQANETSILELSRNSGISRYYLTNKYKEGLNELKKQLQNENSNTGNTSTHPIKSGNIQILDKQKRETSVRV